jgi:putative endonuclease
MFYVYLIQSPADGKIYLGYTSDLKRRIREHESSVHPGWKLAYYEAYRSEVDARKREHALKHHGSGIAELKKRLESSLSNWGGTQ